MAITEIKDKSRKSENLNNTTFTEKKLQIRITLSKGKFKNQEGNTYIINDLAMSVKVEKLGPPDFGKASAEIYGLPLDVMQQLTTLNMTPMFTFRNYITIFAGDDKNGLNQIYSGAITGASCDFNSAPDIKMKIESRQGFFGSVTSQDENFIKGSMPASDFISQQAKKIGFTFKNEGVTSSVKNALFTGSPIEQIRQCASQVGAEVVIDDEQVILLKSERKGNVPILSKDSGLLGYPVMSQNGIELKAIYNKDFRFAGLINIESEIPRTSGTWRIIKLSHSLDANLPTSGKWESSITAFYPHMSGAVGKFV